MFKHILAAGLVALCAMPAAANPYAPAMQGYLQTFISTWANDPVLVQAIKAQNEQTEGYSQADIDAMDVQWRADVYNPVSDLIGPVMSNAAADFLRTQVDLSAGTITEAFVMDARGLNVAVSQPTSDYWQGDEAKFQKTFLLGADVSFIDEVELDKSTGAVQGQVSITIKDPETGEAIGALTVGLNLASLT